MVPASKRRRKRATPLDRVRPYLNPRTIAAAAAALVIGAVLLWWRDRTAPYRMRDAAISAIERRDADALYALTDPAERKATHLTPEAVHRLMDQTLWSHGPLKAIAVRDYIFRPKMDWTEWIVDWGDARGKPIPVQFGLPEALTQKSELNATIMICRGSNGWRFYFTFLVFDYVVHRWYARRDMADVFLRYLEMAHAAGIDGYMNSPKNHVSARHLVRVLRRAGFEAPPELEPPGEDADAAEP